VRHWWKSPSWLWGPLLVALFALPAVQPLLGRTLPRGADSLLHLHRLIQLDHLLRQVLEADRDAALFAEFRDQFTVTGVDPQRHLKLYFFQPLNRGQLWFYIEVSSGHSDQPGDRQCEAGSQEETQYPEGKCHKFGRDVTRFKLKNNQISKLQYKASDKPNRTQEDKEPLIDNNLLLLSNP